MRWRFTLKVFLGKIPWKFIFGLFPCCLNECRGNFLICLLLKDVKSMEDWTIQKYNASLKFLRIALKDEEVHEQNLVTGIYSRPTMSAF